MQKNKFVRGFTLIELLVVIAIIGILGAIVYAPFQTARRKGRDAQKIVEMKNIYSALLLYADSHNGRYPISMSELQANQPSDKLPSNTNFAVGASSADLSKYNYSAYVDTASSSKVIGFHLYTHLETASPALTGAAKCRGTGGGGAASSTCIVTTGNVPNTTTDESTNAKFTSSERTADTDDNCATDETSCIYDIRG